MRKLTALCALVALISSSCTSTPPHYVQAFRATYDAVEPDYRGYIERDTSLDDAARKRKLRTLAAWAVWLKTAEGK